MRGAVCDVPPQLSESLVVPVVTDNAFLIGYSIRTARLFKDKQIFSFAGEQLDPVFQRGAVES
jgi:hypothetical protein